MTLAFPLLLPSLYFFPVVPRPCCSSFPLFTCSSYDGYAASRTFGRSIETYVRSFLRGPDNQTSQNPLPPLNPPSSTFSIDFDIPAQDEAEDSFDILRETHEHSIESLLPPLDDDSDLEFSASSSLPSGIFPTPPASLSATTQSQSIEDLHGKPQFNLASAESLLAAFRDMLHHLPCIALAPDATVPQLAAKKPFLLLAILAAASGSRTLQGHSLYDAEFRKVLGLKFVAGGERTLELLQGLVIYCAW